ncbi:MAG: hypothetical protein K0U78_07025 [Actinomycetia bacterium]|nr:hypothetical protein [Actinomycetes bacterium]
MFQASPNKNEAPRSAALRSSLPSAWAWVFRSVGLQEESDVGAADAHADKLWPDPGAHAAGDLRLQHYAALTSMPMCTLSIPPRTIEWA